MPHKSPDLKFLAVQHYLLTSHNLVETCKIFHCHLMTLYRWVQHFLTYVSFERQHRPSCSYKIRQIRVDEALRGNKKKKRKKEKKNYSQKKK
jgi:transposase-like protein